MFDINKIHDHQRYKIVYKMTGNQDLDVGINFIKHGKNNPDKTGHQHLGYCSVRAVENSEKNGGNHNAGIPAVIYFFNFRLPEDPHPKTFHQTRP